MPLRLHLVERTEVVPVAIDALFRFHADTRNIRAVMPPTTRLDAIDCPPFAESGARFRIRGREFGLVPLRWDGVWESVTPPTILVDRMVSGPMAFWRHEHRFTPVGDTATRLHDRIEFALGESPTARALGTVLARFYLHPLLAFRHHRTLTWARSLTAAGRSEEPPPALHRT